MIIEKATKIIDVSPDSTTNGTDSTGGKMNFSIRARRIIRFSAALVGVAIPVYLINSCWDLAKVARMTKDMKTVCVGRMTIDVPSTVSVSYRAAFISGWTITAIDESTEEFAANLEAKHRELSLSKNNQGGPSLELVRDVNSANASGKMFRYDRISTYGIERGKRINYTSAKTYAYVHGNGRSYVLKSEVGGERLDELAQLIKQIRPREPDEIPAVSGFCIDRALLRDPLRADQNEKVVAFFSFHDHPDFGVALDSSAGLEPGTPLLTRVQNSSVSSSVRRIVLREHDRAIHGVPGQELVEKFFELNGATRHNLYWESFSDKNDVSRPALSFELSTGLPPRSGNKPVNASLADIALLSLWDQMVESIRLRPVGNRP